VLDTLTPGVEAHSATFEIANADLDEFVVAPIRWRARDNRELYAKADAVAVGSGTARLDRESLDAAECLDVSRATRA
jgi:hypothetical protein